MGPHINANVRKEWDDFDDEIRTPVAKKPRRSVRDTPVTIHSPTRSKRRQTQYKSPVKPVTRPSSSSSSSSSSQEYSQQRTGSTQDHITVAQPHRINERNTVNDPRRKSALLREGSSDLTELATQDEPPKPEEPDYDDVSEADSDELDSDGSDSDVNDSDVRNPAAPRIALPADSDDEGVMASKDRKRKDYVAAQAAVERDSSIEDSDEVLDDDFLFAPEISTVDNLPSSMPRTISSTMPPPSTTSKPNEDANGGSLGPSPRKHAPIPVSSSTIGPSQPSSRSIVQVRRTQSSPPPSTQSPRREAIISNAGLGEQSMTLTQQYTLSNSISSKSSPDTSGSSLRQERSQALPRSSLRNVENSRQSISSNTKHRSQQARTETVASSPSQQSGPPADVMSPGSYTRPEKAIPETVSASGTSKNGKSSLQIGTGSSPVSQLSVRSIQDLTEAREHNTIKSVPKTPGNRIEKPSSPLRAVHSTQNTPATRKSSQTEHGIMPRYNLSLDFELPPKSASQPDPIRARIRQLPKDPHDHVSRLGKSRRAGHGQLEVSEKQVVMPGRNQPEIIEEVPDSGSEDEFMTEIEAPSPPAGKSTVPKLEEEVIPEAANSSALLMDHFSESDSNAEGLSILAQSEGINDRDTSPSELDLSPLARMSSLDRKDYRKVTQLEPICEALSELYIDFHSLYHAYSGLTTHFFSLCHYLLAQEHHIPERFWDDFILQHHKKYAEHVTRRLLAFKQPKLWDEWYLSCKTEEQLAPILTTDRLEEILQGLVLVVDRRKGYPALPNLWEKMELRRSLREAA